MCADPLYVHVTGKNKAILVPVPTGIARSSLVVMITIGDHQDHVSTHTGMETLPVIHNSKEKTEMIKNYHTALVTGASHGIGPYIVRALAREGMNLVLAARSESELEQVATAADIRATGVQVLSVPPDVPDRDVRSALVHNAEGLFRFV